MGTNVPRIGTRHPGTAARGPGHLCENCGTIGDTVDGAVSTHSFGLDDFAASLQTFRDGSGRKIQLRPQA